HSATSRHQLELPAWVQVGDEPPRTIGLAMVTTLLADILADDGIDGASLAIRVLDSATAVAEHLTVREPEIDRLWGPDPLTFGESEQALLLGHLVHPTPKGRGEMSAGQRRTYSPETAGRFPLRWLAVEPGLVRQGSASVQSASALAELLLRTDPQTDSAALERALRPLGSRVLMPAHPYQAEHLASEPATADLFDSGAVVDLGAWGSRYLPTTSVRTVCHPDAPWQLKFSLNVRITNSLRVSLPKELDRAVESARLAQTDVGKRAAEVAPDFSLLQDPAYLTIARDGQVHNGFSVLLRENRWQGVRRDVSALTTLCQDHPYGGHSRLEAIVHAIASREDRTVADVARAWFASFRAVVVRSLIRLYLDVGLCFEAHQQNTLVELDDGWPVHGGYRDSQGYFHRALAHDDLTAVIPGLGEASESIFPEALADERLTYYLFVNLTLGVVNALGPCVDEEVLLGDLRRELIEQRGRTGRYPATLLDRLLDDDRWPCKANFLTRANDMDELVGDIASQSVYVSIPNPLRGV
ncbi:MAG: IucA/IucC family siderophore biosynthesis protein, partial [Actinomycetia bacterium]|nr:IucA/IucC family siderophore biosynthesis protein [Actinomycetes bacterium]